MTGKLTPRKLYYTVRPEDLPETAGGILSKLLKSRMGLTAHEISHAKFTEGGITILRKGDSRGQYVFATVKDRAEAGDILRVVFSEVPEEQEKILPVRGEVRILYEDEDVVVLDKPAGMPTHPSHGHYSDTLLNYLAGHYEKAGLFVPCRAVGRLDKDTSGVILFAKNAPAAGRLFRQKETGLFRKTYLAVITKPLPEWETGCLQVIDAPMGPVPGVLMKQAVMAPPLGKRAVTRFRVLSRREGCALIEAEIETGRTHQIRVHLAYAGCPLRGDSLYGGSGGKRALLHAWKAVFRPPFGTGEISVEAPVPADMEEFRD